MNKTKNTHESKIRLLALERILYLNPQGITIKDIIKILNKEFHISTNKNTLESDIEALSLFYYVKTKNDIISDKKYYKIVKRKGAFQKWNRLKLII